MCRSVRRTMFLTTTPVGIGMGVMYQNIARNYMKCAHMYRKIMFLSLTQWGGVMVKYHTFFVRNSMKCAESA